MNFLVVPVNTPAWEGEVLAHVTHFCQDNGSYVFQFENGNTRAYPMCNIHFVEEIV